MDTLPRPQLAAASTRARPRPRCIVTHISAQAARAQGAIH
jgi:hypothetical protein